MARSGKPREHPNKISSMLFYLASIIIHGEFTFPELISIHLLKHLLEDVFRTNDANQDVVDNSSYLDLSPLYGNSEEQQRSVRVLRDGLLKPDAFAEIRLLGFPPGVAALLICFNRFHNYVAGNLAEINEGGRFTKKERLAAKDAQQFPGPDGPDLKRDNDLFQTARL